MKIHGNFAGGNIAVKKQIENEIYLVNELRDTDCDWFYWAFCVEGAEGQKFTFRFDDNRLGYWGPAVSHDLKNWRWLDECNANSFTYSFEANENKVYFAHHLLYHPEQFFSFAESNGLEVFELCNSRKGHSVPCLKLGDGDTSIILTARHHACESTGNYVLQGVIDEFVNDFPSEFRVLCVPFVDYDGVLNGDQGKARVPHDHNRDYIDAPVYPEVSAIKGYIEMFGCNYGFDFHSPWHKGDENDTIFIVRNSVEKEAEFDRFSDIFADEINENSMDYKKLNDHPPLTGWNQPGESFACVMNSRSECGLAFTLESTYFGSAENKVSAERLTELGKCFARSIKKYIKDK